MQLFIRTPNLPFFVAGKKYLGNNILRIFQTRQRRLFGREFILLHKATSDLFEVEAVGDVIGGHEGGQQMGDGTGLATVRPERERVHPPLSVKTNVLFFLEEPLSPVSEVQNTETKRRQSDSERAGTRRPTCGAG